MIRSFVFFVFLLQITAVWAAPFSGNGAENGIGACNITEGQKSAFHSRALRDFKPNLAVKNPEAPRRFMALLINPQSGNELILSELNAYARHEVASTQKILTLYTTFQSLGAEQVSLAQPVTYDPVMRVLNDTSNTKSRNIMASLTKTYGNRSIPLGALVDATYFQSSNAAAYGVAKASSGNDLSEFMSELNEVADELLEGESQSCFQNPHGLQPGLYSVNTSHADCGGDNQYSTMYDMAKLSAKMVMNDEFYSFLEDKGMFNDEKRYNLYPSNIKKHFVKEGFHSTAGSGAAGAARIEAGPCKGWVVGVAAFSEGKTNRRGVTNCVGCSQNAEPNEYIRDVFGFLNYMVGPE